METEEINDPITAATRGETVVIPLEDIRNNEEELIRELRSFPSDRSVDVSESEVIVDSVLTTTSSYTPEEENVNIEEQNTEEVLTEDLNVNECAIMPNSDTLLIKENTSRFSQAIWYDKIITKRVALAGIGGIGSYVGFLLSRLNIEKLYIYDPDIVEEVNMSGQLYSISDVNKPKVQALRSMISNYSLYYKTIAHEELYNPTAHMATEIMMCGFDNMAARKLYFESWLAFVEEFPKIKENCLFIDGRLAAEEFQVFAIIGNDERAINEYKDKWLFTDTEAEHTLCSYKQTTFMANMIASVMVNLFVNFVANQCSPIIERDVPFKTTYSADTMYFNVKM
jgi:hypothetical protein